VRVNPEGTILEETALRLFIMRIGAGTEVVRTEYVWEENRRVIWSRKAKKEMVCRKVALICLEKYETRGHLFLNIRDNENALVICFYRDREEVDLHTVCNDPIASTR